MIRLTALSNFRAAVQRRVGAVTAQRDVIYALKAFMTRFALYLKSSCL